MSKMRTWVKICGITSEEDALAAAKCGADAIGLVFAESPRKVDVARAQSICSVLPSGIKKVGVFVNRELAEVRDIRESVGLDIIQLHGDESPAYCRELGGRYIKTLNPDDVLDGLALDEYGAFAFLLDSCLPGKRGGTGVALDWEQLAARKPGGRLILAGGLNPENVHRAITLVRSFGVDVASGVEEHPGKKDINLMQIFLDEARGEDSE